MSELRPGTFGIARRLVGEAHRHLGADRAEMGGERVGILGDVGRVDPLGAAVDHRELGQLLLGAGDEGVGLGGGRRPALSSRPGASAAAGAGASPLLVAGGGRAAGGEAGGEGEGERETLAFMGSILVSGLACGR